MAKINTDMKTEKITKKMTDRVTDTEIENSSEIKTDIKLEPIWREKLHSEFKQEYMRNLKSFLVTEKKKNKLIYPPSDLIFNAFDTTPFDQVKVVILGQDPYHGPGQAHGLSFSVPKGVPHPPSLVNIFKELKSDLGIQVEKTNGNLKGWAEQGVLLLNAVLTVEEGLAASHQGKGWEQFTDAAIRALNQERENLVFILWGSYAQKKAAFVDTQKHFVLKSVHPSPLSSHRGFFGSKPFSKTNEYLLSKNIPPIDWSRL